MDIKLILEKHAKWIRGEDGGERADLCNANLRGANLWGADLRNANLCDADLCNADLRADLCNVNLRGANLCNANLRGANLRGADLCDADLYGADLRGADLCNADLSGANLRGGNLRNANLSGGNLRNANLSGGNLCGANLRGADLCDADLCGADLHNADLRGAKNTDKIAWNAYTAFYPLQCPETGSFIGYKKASGYIIELEICADAKRSSATSRKCRCSKAKVLAITNLDGSESGLTEVRSNYSKEFIYRVGETVEVPDFDDNRWNECAAGIHFFITRDEAVKYH